MADGPENGEREYHTREQSMHVVIRDKPTGFIRDAWVKHIVIA